MRVKFILLAPKRYASLETGRMLGTSLRPGAGLRLARAVWVYAGTSRTMVISPVAWVPFN
jgi:hypothetical protein